MASTDHVKLLGMWASPYVWRAKIALNIKEVTYEYFEEIVRGNKSELLLESNPIYKKVPVLIHNGKPVCESKIVVQYIHEVWEGTSILPSDPLESAEARFWAFYIDDKIFTSFISLVKAKTEEAKVQGVEQTISGLKLLEDYIAEKPFFGGDNIGYVDIALGSWLPWFKAAEEVESITVLDEEKFPNLVKWAERFSSDNRVKEVMPDHNKLIEYYKILQETVWISRPAAN